MLLEFVGDDVSDLFRYTNNIKSGVSVQRNESLIENLNKSSKKSHKKLDMLQSRSLQWQIVLERFIHVLQAKNGTLQNDFYNAMNLQWEEILILNRNLW